MVDGLNSVEANPGPRGLKFAFRVYWPKNPDGTTGAALDAPGAPRNTGRRRRRSWRSMSASQWVGKFLSEVVE